MTGTYWVEATRAIKDRNEVIGFGVWWHGPSGQTRVKVRGFSAKRLGGAHIALSNANAHRDKLNARILARQTRDGPKQKPPSQALIAATGELLFGPCWQAALARSLGVSDRSLRYWMAYHPIPVGVRGDLMQVMRDQISKIEAALREMQRV